MTDGSQAMGERSPPVSGAERYNLDTFGLLAGALRAVQALWLPALGLWFARVALGAGIRAANRALGEAVRLPGRFVLGNLTSHLPGDLPDRLRGNLAGFLAFEAVTAAAIAILSALMLRLFLAPRTRWWRPDRNLAAAVAILALANLGASAFALAGIAGLDLPGPLTVTKIGARAGLQLAALIVQLFVYSHLVLWPAGAAAGDREMTPARSWRLMGGHALSYIGAVIVLQLPMFLWVTIAGLARLGPAVVQPFGIPLATLVGPVTQILGWAVVANLYRALAVTAVTASPPKP